ncbi:hypothetical protein PGIN_84-3_00199 [Porphyromonas gingivalis]|nr:hypothetical protein PGIN_84-3_00199 [Porphyromonas gingivalis]
MILYISLQRYQKEGEIGDLCVFKFYKDFHLIEREFDIKEWHNTLVISVFYFPHSVFQVLILLSNGFLSTSEAQ